MRRYILSFFHQEVETWSGEARWLYWLTCLWLFIGLIALFSASYAVDEFNTGDGLFSFKKQLIWAFLGIVCFHVVVRSPIQKILKIAPLVFLFLLVLIILTVLPGIGTTANGATRWLALGPIQIQPSELIKPFLILQSANIFGQWHRLKKEVRITWLIIFGIMLVAILKQPNLSTTALCGMSLWLIAVASGLPWSYLITTVMLGLSTAIVSISLQDYQRRRVISFLNPWADPREDGYQLIQSLLAIASGGLDGTGYGLSQQKLFYLPFQDTDFIFSIFAEEFGLIGCLALLLLLITYATIALAVSIKCEIKTFKLVAIGVTIFLVGQSLLHIGVATGVLPTTGLPLPLFSYGGSSLVGSLFMSGLLIRVARETSQAKVISLSSRRRQN